MQLILTILLCLLIASATAYFANKRGRDPFLWFMLGTLLGIFGLILLFFLPSSQVETVPDAQELLPEHKKSPQPEPAHDYLIKDWYYYDHQQQRHGPIRFDQLRDLWKRAELGEDSYVWSEGMSNWQKIEELHPLYTHLQLGGI